ncbi:MAG: WD40 repeat domain-containing protein [Gemmataceae bacterium]
MRVLTGPKVSLRSLAFSPDGAKLAAGGHRAAVQVWDLRTGQGRRYVVGGSPVWAVYWLTEDRIAVQLPWWCAVLDVGDGQITFPRNDSPDRFFLSVPSPDRRATCVGDSGRVGRYAVATGALKWETRLGPGDQVAALAWAAGGAVIAAGFHSGEVRAYDAATGAEAWRAEGFGRAGVNAVACSPDGVSVASCAATHLHLRSGGRTVAHHAPGKTHFLGVAWHPSGDFFASANGDGAVDYWEGRTGVKRESFDWGVGKLNGVTFDAAGDRAACCSGRGDVVVWDVDH